MNVVAHWDLEQYVDDDGFLVDRAYIETLFLEVTGELLPQMAAANDWPIVYDHCFQRVCYDTAYGDEWYDYIEGRPAYKNIEDAKLLKALTVGIYMLCMGEPAVIRYNQRSLYYRGEISEEDMDVTVGDEQ
jgi:hypothetical protein